MWKEIENYKNGIKGEEREAVNINMINRSNGHQRKAGNKREVFKVRRDPY